MCNGVSSWWSQGAPGTGAHVGHVGVAVAISYMSRCFSPSLRGGVPSSMLAIGYIAGVVLRKIFLSQSAAGWRTTWGGWATWDGSQIASEIAFVGGGGWLVMLISGKVLGLPAPLSGIATFAVVFACFQVLSSRLIPLIRYMWALQANNENLQAANKDLRADNKALRASIEKLSANLFGRSRENGQLREIRDELQRKCNGLEAQQEITLRERPDEDPTERPDEDRFVDALVDFSPAVMDRPLELQKEVTPVVVELPPEAELPPVVVELTPVVVELSPEAKLSPEAQSLPAEQEQQMGENGDAASSVVSSEAAANDKGGKVDGESVAAADSEVLSHDDKVTGKDGKSVADDPGALSHDDKGTGETSP